MLNKRGEEEVKEDLKDRIVNSLTMLDSEVIKEAIQRQNKNYAIQFNDKCNDIKDKIQKAPDFLRISLNKQLERIREKAKKHNLIN